MLSRRLVRSRLTLLNSTLLIFRFFVQRVQFFVGRFQLFLRGFQFLVARLRLFVRCPELFQRDCIIFDDRLKILFGCRQLAPQPGASPVVPVQRGFCVVGRPFGPPSSKRIRK